MTDLKLYLSIGVPVLTNVALFGLFVMFIDAKFDGLNAKFDAKFDGVAAKFAGVDAKFAGVVRSSKA